MFLARAYNALSRKRTLESQSSSKLAKVLTKFDLTALGIGSTLGVGVYVLAGKVSRDNAGPAVILSFLIAAIASVFAGLCYAEFGARVPKAGSAYIYSYVTIGEFIAFLIGWNLILEYAIGTASVATAFSSYVDSLTNYTLRNFLIENFPMNTQGLSSYPDVLAFGITILFTFAIALGARESTMMNSIFTCLNMAVVIFVIIAGLFKVDSNNWKLPRADVPENCGNGGFFPYGAKGVIQGAAFCFYGFIGFDVIATAGEETKNPKKSIPFAVIVSLLIIFLSYFGISTVLTMMVPYYDQDVNAPLPSVFRAYGWTAAEYIVHFGALLALCASLMGAAFPLPRVIFAMASDGLLFRFMENIHPRFKTPFAGTLVSGFITAFLAAIFNLDQLVNMMSIGTLLAYSMVASCVLILRYECDDEPLEPNEESKLVESQSLISRMFNLHKDRFSSAASSNVVTVSITMYCVWCLILALMLNKFNFDFTEISVLDLSIFATTIVLVIVTLFIISRQPVSTTKIYFKVPLVPWLPGVSIFINMYLMVNLDVMTWVRFVVWIIIGLAIYFGYSIRHSKEKLNAKGKAISLESSAENSS